MTSGVFQRVVCGVDGSAASLEAVRQADLLLDPGGRLLLVAAVDPMQAIHFQIAPTAVHAARHALEEIEDLEQRVEAVLERALAEVTHASEVVTRDAGGPPATCLLDAVASEEATLLAVGMHGHSRVAGIVLGSVAARVLHEAPTTVLVARPRASGSWSPRTIVVGRDGSPSAEAALHACRELESRFGAELRVVRDVRRPSHTLVDAAAGADLLAVGSGRSRHVLGLGSVSEHVARHARCSVLVAREASRQPTANGSDA